MKTKFRSLIIFIFIINQLNAAITENSFMIKSTGDSGSDGIKGKVMLGAGVGFNLLGTSLTVKYDQSNYYRPFDTRGVGTATPMFNFSVDYGILKKFSAGAAFGYQTATVVVTDYNGYYYGTDSWKRIHIAARMDYSIVGNENLNLYTGLKFGFNIYSMTSTIISIDPFYISQLDVYPSPYSIQAHFGFSYYFMKVIGFNAEVGLGYGGPYMAAVGLAVKF